MKLKSALAISSVLYIGVAVSNAATFVVNNLVDTVSETLYADAGSNPLNGSVATIGYFPAGVVISSLQDLTDNLGSFLTLDSALIGQTSSVLGSDVAGIAFNAAGVDGGNVPLGSPLIGRTIYTIFGNGATLGSSTLYGAVQIGSISADVPTPNTYTSNPAGGTVVVGSVGTWQGDLGFGGGTLTYNTVNLVPEPSAALLGALGALGLLRRRRA